MEIEKDAVIAADLRFREILSSYYRVNYKDTEIEEKLTNIDLLIKATCLLNNIKEIEVRRDIQSWENTLKALEDVKKKPTKKRVHILSNIHKKLKLADKLMQEVFNMKQY